MKLDSFKLIGKRVELEARVFGAGTPVYCLVMRDETEWMNIKALRELCNDIVEDMDALFYSFVDEPKAKAIAEFEEAWNHADRADADGADDD